MKFRMSIDTGDAAFAPTPGLELARLLRLTAEKLEAGMAGGQHKLLDLNGNTCGTWNLR